MSQQSHPPTARDQSPPPPPPQGDATHGVIPYKNPCALIAYYLAVFSLIPILGIFTGIAALVLGIIGLHQRMKRPHLKGSAHAWIGIILGAICAIGWTGLIVLTALGVIFAS